MATLFANDGPNYQQTFNPEKGNKSRKLMRFYSIPVGGFVRIKGGVAEVLYAPTDAELATSDSNADYGVKGDTTYDSIREGKLVWQYGRGSFTIATAEATLISSLPGSGSWLT